MYCLLLNRPELLGSYYRKATVYTSFATTALGLCALAVITAMDYHEKIKDKKIEAQQIPPGVGSIQSTASTFSE